MAFVASVNGYLILKKKRLETTETTKYEFKISITTKNEISKTLNFMTNALFKIFSSAETTL